MVALAILLFNSCQKPDKVQQFDDIFDVSGVISLNEKIDNSNSVSGLADLVPESGLNVPENMSIEKLEEMCTFLEQNIKLSDDETDKLLKNDPNTLLEVITRFGNLPAEFGDKDMNFEELSKSTFSKYLLVQKEEPGVNYYPDDYYSAIQAYRGYIENCIIKPMKKLHTVVLHDQSQLPHGAKFQYYVLIAMNNNWAMWWSYWRFGNIIFKIKHKGGAGSFPG
jgi:hypothetical protein